MKKIVAFAISVLLLLTFSLVTFAEPYAQNWYCVRNKEHRQPIVGSDIGYVENYCGYYIDRKHGDNTSEKKVYLTFDSGYENGNVEKILDVLKDKQVSGAFFILSSLVNKNTDLVKRMADEGHLVCNHSSTHRDMTTLTSFEDFKAEIEALENVYKDATGREVNKYFRPPEGRFNENTLKYAQELGYKTIFWSFAYADWDNNAQMSHESAKKKILENVHNGAVILLHPTSETNAAILGEVIDELRSQGYSFGTLDELTAE